MNESKFAQQRASFDKLRMSGGNPTDSSAARRRGRPRTRLSTIDEVAQYLHISRSTIYRLIDSKQLPHLRIGYVLRFDIPTVLRWAQDFTDRGDQLTWQDDATNLKRAR